MDDTLGGALPRAGVGDNDPVGTRGDLTKVRRETMAKYLLKAAYTVVGTKGLLKEGGSARRAAFEQAVRSLGGTVEAYYYCFGEADIVTIVDLPDATSAAALSLRINAAGAVASATTPLVTTDEIDRACKKSVKYRPPRG